MKEITLKNSQRNFNELRSNNNKILQNLGAPHVDSFNYMLNNGLNDCIRNINPVKFDLINGDRIELCIKSIHVEKPTVPLDEIKARTKLIYPTECRQRQGTYSGLCTIEVGWSVNGIVKSVITKDMGEIPIMIRSSACNLNGLDDKALILHGEHEDEWGGYFIIKGHEKLIRMLLMIRRNFPISILRNTWKNRGKLFSEYGILIRTVKEDETGTTNVLHFLKNGSAKLMMSYRKMLSYIPIMLLLKTLTNFTDNTIFEYLIAGFENDQYYRNCIENMLRELHEENLHTQSDCKEYLGKIFRSRFFDLPTWLTNVEITDFMLNECILIHLSNHLDKFYLFIFMIQKLFQTVNGNCLVEGSDRVMMQEVLQGGHLYQQIVKERLINFLQQAKFSLIKRITSTTHIITPADIILALKSTSSIERPLSYFLATGNLSSNSGLGMMQDTGLVIMAENINRVRYMSHFRAVHRGSFFVTMRTTEARQLLPDAWGFICPVHTPDGTPCGLLNHLTSECVITKSPDVTLYENIPKILVELGMTPIGSSITLGQLLNFRHYCIVMLDGRVIGYILYVNVELVIVTLRQLKIEGVQIPNTMEIAYIPKKEKGQYSGLFLFCGPSRMMRPVINLNCDKIEYIGTLEQVYMDICITKDEIYEKFTTHMEISKTSFLSNLAKLIPMPDCNQSPRNMYQCQMSKQTMGTPCHNWQLQSGIKLYRLQTPSSPIFRPVHHDDVNLDDFALGTNAIVAVISYTGYDMEDAMVINKASYERGFAHGSIYKSEFIELKHNSYFVRNPHDKSLDEYLDNDGFPYVGRKIIPRAVFYCYFDANEAVYKTVKFHGKEECYIDSIRLCGNFNASATRMACITVRVQRNPNVGDKFASRAGQKGICSQKWQMEDLPFSATGIVPDIIFNPHGFPSRMTIAMMIEIMAGKGSACNGFLYDATPFNFTENDTAIDHFGQLLEASGYNYYGTETFYSGIDGREMTANIFSGIVYYQRLRHMVSDKWQVRSTGAIDMVTQQPVGGRKRGGGVRFGEMERDALIAHGASFLLRDRLFRCSDKITTLICRNCGTLLGPLKTVVRRTNNSNILVTPPVCRICEKDSDIEYIEIPYIFKYLTTQLTAVNINVKLDCKEV